jgi:hypothetical protein
MINLTDLLPDLLRHRLRSLPQVAALCILFAAGARSAEASVIGDDAHTDQQPSVGLTAGLGIRSDLVRSAGLDAFSTTDGVPQSALSVSYRLGGTERAVVAIGFEWNHGTTTAAARGTNAVLTIDRLSLGLEGRVPMSRRFSLFARVAPGLLRDHASLIDGSAPGGAFNSHVAGGMEQTTWVAAADVSAGVAFRIGEVHGQASPVLGFWLIAETGYGYSRAHDLVLSSRVETQPGRIDEPLHLGQLALRGAFGSFRVAMSF